MNMSPEQLTDQLRGIYADNLEAVVLYGSAASGDYSRKYSDFNVLVVLARIGTDELRKARKVVHRWVKQGNPPPLIFTADRLRKSADVFPMEIADIKEFNRVLHGRNPVEDVEVAPENLRLELERELKGKLIQLRQRFLDVAGNEKAERELLARSSATFLTLFRHALRLAGADPLPPKAEAAGALAGRIGYASVVFDRIRGLRETGKLPPGVKADALIEEYLPFVERVVDLVDAWAKGRELTGPLGHNTSHLNKEGTRDG